MRIAKLIRFFGSSAIAALLAVGSALLLSRWIGLWGYAVGLLLFPFFNFLGGVPINALDFLLRRTTKDEISLRSHEGKQWLQTEQGQAWQEGQRVQRAIHAAMDRFEERGAERASWSLSKALAVDSEKVVVRVVYEKVKPPGRAYFAVFDSGAIEELSFERVAADYGEKPWR